MRCASWGEGRVTAQPIARMYRRRVAEKVRGHLLRSQLRCNSAVQHGRAHNVKQHCRPSSGCKAATAHVGTRAHGAKVAEVARERGSGVKAAQPRQTLLAAGQNCA